MSFMDWAFVSTTPKPYPPASERVTGGDGFQREVWNCGEQHVHQWEGAFSLHMAGMIIKSKIRMHDAFVRKAAHCTWLQQVGL
jgi:hypothetical protein